MHLLSLPSIQRIRDKEYALQEPLVTKIVVKIKMCIWYIKTLAFFNELASCFAAAQMKKGIT